MRPVSNHPAWFYVSAKTHKFDNVNDVNLDQLKFPPIMDQTGTYILEQSYVYNKLPTICSKLIFRRLLE